MKGLCFDAGDVEDLLPSPGVYRSRISTARFRKSASGNRMLQVVYALEDIAAGHDRVAEYFVLEGESRYAIALAKRSLVDLYRACGFEPKAGDEIAPADLFGVALEVSVDHDEWNGRPRLRIVGHHKLGSRPDGDVPF